MRNRDLEVEILSERPGDAGANRHTCYADVVRRPDRAPDRIDFGAELRRHYTRFRDVLRDFDRPGVGVVAVDRARDQVAGVACIAGRIGEPNGLIVGRHSEVDLWLGDPEVSLRQLAVVLEPLSDLARPGRGVTYRVLDLRSLHGFSTEEGKALGGIRADGPAFLASGNHVFFFFVTGDPTDWPESATDAWSFIPERVYLEERRRHARGSRRRRRVGVALPRSRRGITLVQKTRPAERLAPELVGRDEIPVAELVVAGAGQVRRIPVGAAALEDAILVGRSERCDFAGLLRDPLLSRVHLLLIDIAGTIYALDTASTNGCSLDREQRAPFRIQPVGPDQPLHLAGRACLSWRWAT